MNRSLPADPRQEQLLAWLAQLPAELRLRPQSLRPASSDASFRRYFRLDAGPLAEGGASAGAPAPSSWIVMDAPPEHENCRVFVQVAQVLADQKVSTPAVIAHDFARGFLLLSDFGNTTYWDALRQPGTDVAVLYGAALEALVRMQQANVAHCLPAYDGGRLHAEMRLFADWYVTRHLGETLSASEKEVLERSFAVLVDAARAQAQVLVHRDYHSRNLMVLPPSLAAGLAPRRSNPGVLDFQDAVLGPISYDLVSLLRDAYVEWPEDQQIDWAARYWERARAAQLPVPHTFDVFWEQMEWMGLQRTLKILGIFARLNYRDGKARYLDDLPLVQRHTQRVVERYGAFAGLARLLDRVHRRTAQTGFTF